MNILYVTYFLNWFLMIAMPLGLAIYLTRAWKLSWRFWLVGAATFILAQVGHIPFLYLANLALNRPPLVNVFLGMPKVGLVIFNGLFIGLAAGLFEELSRYAMFRWWLKDARSWRTGVLAGAGHGGAEAIIMGALTLLSFINLVALRAPAVMATVPANQLATVQAQLAAAWAAPWYDTLLGAVERLSAIIIQISMAALVLQTFVRKQGFWLWLAVLYHTLIDFFTVPFAAGYLNKYALEALVGGFALLSLFIIFKLRQPEAEEPIAPLPAPVSPAETSLQPVEETPENLDNSKFQ